MPSLIYVGLDSILGFSKDFMWWYFFGVGIATFVGFMEFVVNVARQCCRVLGVEVFRIGGKGKEMGGKKE